MTKTSKTADLLKILSGAGSPPATEKPPVKAAAREPRSKPRAIKKEILKPEQPRKAAGPVRGKAIQFYLHAEDEKIIRELAAWLAPHRKRINDSLIIKSALRAVKTGHEFLAGYDAAVQVDGRTRLNKGQTR